VFTRTYDGAQLTSSPPTTAFSDFPPERGEYQHWSKEEYVAYLNRYVDHFQLRGKIRFKNLLKDARYDDELGGWLLEISTGTKSITEGPFDTLVVCTGQNRTPNLPQTDLSGFTGEVLHSARYQNPARFAGKRVVVVGIGETSADIVADIAAVADTCTLSARNGAYVIPRINPRTGEPNDFDSNRLRYALPKWAHNLAVTVCDRAYARWGASGREARRRVALLGETKLAKPFRQFATKSDRFIKMIEAGQCQMAKGFVGFTPNGIRTQDNREIPADVVVFATGYRASGWKFFSDENLPTCPSHFWRMMYTSSYQEKLAFIGFVRPSIGSVPPVAELQARYAARIASGDVKLPDRTTQLHDIERRKQARLASFDNQRLALLVDWIPFMDTLADQIGCRPNLRGLLRKPSLLWRVSTGPMVAAQYRLLGPDATPELAAETLESLPPGMRLRDKLWFFAIHALLSMGAPFEALPSRREYRACTLI
ncbi:MAG: flavin-containing monooxygenase, partial [Nannocystaceae bacterium]